MNVAISAGWYEYRSSFVAYEIRKNELITNFSGKLNYLTLTDPTKVWMPDTFFRNEKEAKKHEIIVPNVYVRIYPNGDILYSIR